jgi:hypothetical protein
MREKADADYRRANLDSAMGTGTDADVLKAKQALDLIVGQLEGLESARVESNRLQAARDVEERRAAHEAFVETTDDLLEKREAIVARIEEMARTIGDEIKQYEALTAQMRSAASAYRPYFRPVDLVAHIIASRVAAVFGSLTRKAPLVPLVMATIENNQLLLDGKPLSAREAHESRAVRSSIVAVAPEREMA